MTIKKIKDLDHDDDEYFTNPFTGRPVKKSTNSRTYKKLIKEGLIEGNEDDLPKKGRPKTVHMKVSNLDEDTEQEPKTPKPKTTKPKKLKELDDDTFNNELSKYLHKKLSKSYNKPRTPSSSSNISDDSDSDF